MKFVKGITFAPFSHRGDFSNPEAFASIDELCSRTNADLIIFVPCAVQDTPQSEHIDFAAQ